MKVGDLVYAHNLPVQVGIKRGFVGIVHRTCNVDANYVYVFVLKESAPRIWNFGDVHMCRSDALIVLRGSQ